MPSGYKYMEKWRSEFYILRPPPTPAACVLPEPDMTRILWHGLTTDNPMVSPCCEFLSDYTLYVAIYCYHIRPLKPLQGVVIIFSINSPYMQRCTWGVCRFLTAHQMQMDGWHFVNPLKPQCCGQHINETTTSIIHNLWQPTLSTSCNNIHVRRWQFVYFEAETVSVYVVKNDEMASDVVIADNEDRRLEKVRKLINTGLHNDRLSNPRAKTYWLVMEL